MEKKYELVMEDSIILDYHTLYRIKALRDFSYVKKGDLGGYIQSEENLSHEGNCWVYGGARVYGGAKVYNNAIIVNYARLFNYAQAYDDARIYDYANVFDYAEVFENAEVYDKARIYGKAKIYNDAQIYGSARVFRDAKVYKNVRVYGEANIGLNGNIHSHMDHISIGPIGSRDKYTTFYKANDKNIYVACGCFNDTIEKFEEQVLKTHKDNELYKKQYLGIIRYIKDTLI